MSRFKRLFMPLTLLSTGAFGFWYLTYKNSVNSQKWGSNLFKGLMFHIRHDDHLVSLLGTPIQFDKDHQQVKGDVNMIKGRADIEFLVSGAKNDGLVKFKGMRVNEGNQWVSEIFQIEVKNHHDESGADQTQVILL